MGQYHYVANMDKREKLDPWNLGSGFKLKEQIWNTPGTPVALFILTVACNGRGGGDVNDEHNYDHKTGEGIVGRWAGDRIITVGDYFDEDDAKNLNVPVTSLHAVWSDVPVDGKPFKDISDDVRKVMNLIGLGGKYVWKPYSEEFQEDEGGENGHYVFEESPLHY